MYYIEAGTFDWDVHPYATACWLCQFLHLSLRVYIEAGTFDWDVHPYATACWLCQFLHLSLRVSWPSMTLPREAAFGKLHLEAFGRLRHKHVLLENCGKE
jgi:hypothetical protein